MIYQKLAFQNQEYQIYGNLSRPTLHIKEHSVDGINHLTKDHVWEKMILSVDPSIIDNNPAGNFSLKMYDNGILLETWELTSNQSSCEVNGHICKLTLNITDVRYLSHLVD